MLWMDVGGSCDDVGGNPRSKFDVEKSGFCNGDRRPEGEAPGL